MLRVASVLRSTEVQPAFSDFFTPNSLFLISYLSSAGVLPESSSPFSRFDAIAGPSSICVPQVPKRAFFWLYDEDESLEEQANSPVKRSRFRAIQDSRGETGAESELSQ